MSATRTGKYGAGAPIGGRQMSQKGPNLKNRDTSHSLKKKNEKKWKDCRYLDGILRRNTWQYESLQKLVMWGHGVAHGGHQKGQNGQNSLFYEKTPLLRGYIWWQLSSIGLKLDPGHLSQPAMARTWLWGVMGLRMEPINGVKMVKIAIFMAKVTFVAVQTANIVMIRTEISS